MCCDLSGDVDVFSTLSVTGGTDINSTSPSVAAGTSADVLILSMFKFAVDSVSGRISTGTVTCPRAYSLPRYRICSKLGDHGDLNGPTFSRARAKLTSQQNFGR
jgi:hypothetical protein